MLLNPVSFTACKTRSRKKICSSEAIKLQRLLGNVLLIFRRQLPNFLAAKNSR